MTNRESVMRFLGSLSDEEFDHVIYQSDDMAHVLCHFACQQCKDSRGATGNEHESYTCPFGDKCTMNWTDWLKWESTGMISSDEKIKECMADYNEWWRK